MPTDNNTGLGVEGYRNKLRAFVQDIMRVRGLDLADADKHTTRVLDQLGFTGAFDSNDKLRANDVVTALVKILEPPQAQAGEPDTNSREWGGYTFAEFQKLPADRRLAIANQREHATAQAAKEAQRKSEDAADIRDLPPTWNDNHHDGGPVWSPEAKLRWLEERRHKEAEQRKAINRLVAQAGAQQ